MDEVGIRVDNTARLSGNELPVLHAVYPWFVLVAGGMAQPGEMEYAYDTAKIERYTISKVGDTCSIPSRDATLKLIESELQVAPAMNGGECDITEFQQKLAQVKPSDKTENKVTISIAEKPAKVDSDKARELADRLNNRLKSPMPITVDKESQDVPEAIIYELARFQERYS